MNFKKSGNFNWIEMDSKDQNLDWTRRKRIHFNPFSFAEGIISLLPAFRNPSLSRFWFWKWLKRTGLYPRQTQWLVFFFVLQSMKN